MYNFTSTDPEGTSPTQGQLDKAIHHAFVSYPTPKNYNIGIWQPHKVSDTIIKDIWKFLENYCNLAFDYESMLRADKQIWWMIYPETKEVESNKTFNGVETIISRENIVDIITKMDHKKIAFDKLFEEDSKKGSYNSMSAIFLTLVRQYLPSVYMKLQAIQEYLYSKHGYHPSNLNKMFQFSYEFNYTFGKYFNNIPVIPITMSTYFSIPRIVKHLPRDEIKQNDSGSMLIQAARPLSYIGKTKTFNPACWWNKEENSLGRRLTIQEFQDNYQNNPIREDLRSKELKFNLEDELFSDNDSKLFVDNIIK